MAERRMFTKKVTDDDNFMALSSSAQALYLHLSMSADDDGFCNQVSISMFKAHASVQDLQALLEKRYVYQFENGVIVIKHWRMANALRKDRYTPTAFQEELSQLGVKDNGSYTMLSEGEVKLIKDCTPDSEISTARQLAYRNSDLPYSFDYKIRQAFYGRKCPVCGSTMARSVDEDGIVDESRIPTVQHNLPISKGGKHELGNISVICHKCNVTIKDDITGELNSAEVVEEWDKITGCRLVATCLPQEIIGKGSIDKSRLLDGSKEPLSDSPAGKSNAIVAEVIDYLNEKAGTAYRANTKANATLILARYKEGATLEDFKSVIDKKVAEWKGDTRMEQYLRPKTLFAAQNFDSYLGAKVTPTKRVGANGIEYVVDANREDEFDGIF